MALIVAHLKAAIILVVTGEWIILVLTGECSDRYSLPLPPTSRHYLFGDNPALNKFNKKPTTS